MRATLDDGVTFSSDFDSGNLSRVERVGAFEYSLWVSPDCAGTPYEQPYTTWWFFSVQGAALAGTTATFHLRNLNVQQKLYSQDMRPVFCSVPSASLWTRVPTPVIAQCDKLQSTMVVTLTHTFPRKCDGGEVFYFAFTYPYSYQHLQDQLAHWVQHHPPKDFPSALPSDILFQRETLCLSAEGRLVDLIAITNYSGWSAASETGPDFPVGAATGEQVPGRIVNSFPGKKVVLVSARVHPGEIPASHVVHGLVQFLLSNDPRAHAARTHFVFLVIPCLNPDGVARGHYRLDPFGTNLNREFISPDPVQQPSVCATKELFLFLHGTQQLAFYVDLHGHATRRGCFIFGNAVPFPEQLDILLFSKLVAINTPYFDFSACNFSERNMSLKDRRDASKEGTSRVRLFQETGFLHCYTMECNYNTVVELARVPAIPLDRFYPAAQPDLLAENFPQHTVSFLPGQQPRYIPEMYHDVGRALACAALDFFELNPHSRMSQSSFHNLEGVRTWVARNSRRITSTPPRGGKGTKGKAAVVAASKQALNETGALAFPEGTLPRPSLPAAPRQPKLRPRASLPAEGVPSVCRKGTPTRKRVPAAVTNVPLSVPALTSSASAQLPANIAADTEDAAPEITSKRISRAAAKQPRRLLRGQLFMAL
eukprot:TRINITY_DN17261_c0_g1_i1.p1 TRINITY_DN17261_c0_g1~~TRINITY_DN17261_c0_g1_i1.p1  ORF type:complete len:652 (+),score=82.26 TRINITY_DN17261_c0_g1_i1:48-2003(+)